ncbi:MAG: DNA primase [Firmicutes bacterium]|nr:DNA primase [Bacillota bacterium]
MRGGFDQLLIEDVRAHTDIVEVISRYVNLRKTGKYYMGLCPFHIEKTPSFAVSPERQVFHCFGCQAGGDVFAFLMKRENVSFPEAVKDLAERAGIRIPDPRESAEESRKRSRREAILRALEWATAYYERVLGSDAGREAREYLERRGVSRELARKFRLGYATESWDALIAAARAEGIAVEDLLAAGLVSPREQGTGYYSRFRNRVMYPVSDHRGRVLGFGGRLLETGGGTGGVQAGSGPAQPAPKYVNSPETDVYVKGRVWYALYLAKDAVRRKNQAIVVEGYMDAIACHGAGIDNVVASCGTALTQEQIQAIVPLGCEVVVSFDSDSAGTAATLRSLELLKGAGCRVRVAQVPEGKDPDEFVRAAGGEKFLQVVDAALPVVDYIFRKAVEEHGAADPVAKGAVVEKIAPFLWSISNEVEQAAYVSRISEELRVSSESVWAVVRKRARTSQEEVVRHKNALGLHTIDGKKSVENLVQDGSTPAVQKAEENLVRMMLAGIPDDRLRQISQECFTGSRFGRLARHALALIAEGGAVDLGLLINRLDDEDLVSAAASLAVSGDAVFDERIFRDCVFFLKKRRLAALTELIARCDAGNSEQRISLMREMQSLLSEVKGSA